MQGFHAETRLVCWFSPLLWLVFFSAALLFRPSRRAQSPSQAKLYLALPSSVVAAGSQASKFSVWPDPSSAVLRSSRQKLPSRSDSRSPVALSTHHSAAALFELWSLRFELVAVVRVFLLSLWSIDPPPPTILPLIHPFLSSPTFSLHPRPADSQFLTPRETCFAAHRHLSEVPARSRPYNAPTSLSPFACRIASALDKPWDIAPTTSHSASESRSMLQRR